MTARQHVKMLGSALIGTCLAIAAAGNALAGEIKLSTVRIDLTDLRPSAAITVTNTSAEKTIVQMRALSWTQATGHDATEPTGDLIINPPIAEIQPGARQLVRIGYAGKLQGATEKSYRFSVEEVPQRDRERKQVIETYLKISVPIFIAPLGKAESHLSASLAHDMAGGLVLSNDGTTHTRLVSYSVTSKGTALGDPHQGLFYVLPGAHVSLPLNPPELTPAAPAGIDILTDEGPIKLPLRSASE